LSEGDIIITNNPFTECHLDEFIPGSRYTKIMVRMNRDDFTLRVDDSTLKMTVVRAVVDDINRIRIDSAALKRQNQFKEQS
jgi:hypothetical protein